MTSLNPYLTPSTCDSELVNGEEPSTKRLWIAYGISPLVAPLVSALAVFILGVTFYDPNDRGTPIGIIAVPFVLLVVGIPMSYFVVGFVGMPIAFALRRRNRLNGYTVHGTALLGAVLIALGLSTLLVATTWFRAGELPGLFDLLAGTSILFVGLATFGSLSATTFWLIGVRPASRRRNSANASLAGD